MNRIALAFCVVLLTSASSGADADKPASADEIKTLVTQLGDGQFKVREAASDRLKQIGQPALPALREALKCDDPEIQTRAENIIRRIELRPIPGGPIDPNARIVAHSISQTIEGDTKIVRVVENDRQIELKESPKGIELTITGEEDGKDVTRTYRGATPEELKAQNPDAHVIYQRWAGGGGVEWIINNGLGGVVINGPFARGGPLPISPLDIFRIRLVDAMKKGNIAPEQRKAVLELLEQTQQAGVRELGVPQDQHDRRLQDYFNLANDLRAKLAELKLPEPPEELPPPANARLGVELSTTIDGQLIVQNVIPGFRAEKLGIKVGDVLVKVGEVQVHTIKDLREALINAKQPILVEIVRDGETTKLTEKAERKD